MITNKGVARVISLLLGLLLIVLGANAFLQFMSPPSFNAEAGAFLGALAGAGYVFPLLGLAFLLTGVLYVINKARAFGSIVLLPFSVNLVAFHIFLDTSAALFAWVIFVVNVYLVATDFDKYKSMFS